MDSKKNFINGAISGFVEVSICHPLDTIKTRIQNRLSYEKNLIDTIKSIYIKEGINGYYRGIISVYFGIIPKNAIRFTSFNLYNQKLENKFISGLFAGITESVLVVTPTDVCKLRIQTQYNSLKDPIISKNLNQIIKDIYNSQGIKGFYKGVYFTSFRQGINQASNFYIYYKIKDNYDMPSFIAGCLSGSIGPIINNPIDVIKTRLQSNEKNIKSINIIKNIYRNFGIKGFYKGLIPRLLRIIPGQGITFTVFDYLSKIY